MIDIRLWRWRLAVLTLTVASMICLALDATAAAIFAMLGACIALIHCGRIATGGYANFTCVFLFFFLLYGLSGPVAAHFGAGLHPMFPRPYLTNEILFLIGLSVAGLALGIWSTNRSASHPNAKKRSLPITRDLFLLSYMFATAASAMEVINTMRAGGFGMVALGKAYLQSTVADLTWTLPAELFLLLAAAFFGLAIAANTASRQSVSVKLPLRVSIWLLMATPAILIYLALGRRSVLLSVAIAVFVGAFWHLTMSRLRWVFVLVVALGYVFMGAIFVARAQVGIGLATGNWDDLRQGMTSSEFWARSLNPATIEFGGTFGNINTFLLAGGDHLRLGETYAEGLAVEIPRSVWPSKPRTATYEFRDKHFPELAERGTIAGTAFSSLLEALMNFGVGGILFVFAAIGVGISSLERTRAQCSSTLLFPLFYILLLPEAMTFHRGSFDNPFAWPLLLAVTGTLAYLVLRGFKVRAGRMGPV